MNGDTVLHRLHKNAQTLVNAPAYLEKVDGRWVSTTWKTYTDQVRQAARALIALGLQPGEIVTVLGFNSPEWVIMDLGAMLMGGAIAGIYTTNSPLEVKYIVEHAESKVILLQDQKQWEKIKQVREDMPCLKHVVMMRKAPPIDDPMVLSWEAFLAKGSSVSEETIDQRLAALREDQLATLIYTSGTTGPPKGVMLSHKNLAWTAQTAVDLLQLRSSDTSLSYLPLSHIAEQVFSIHAPISCGSQIYFAETFEKVADNLKEVQPTILFGVPRVWEKFYDGISTRLKGATGVRAKLAQWAMKVGKQAVAVKNRGQEPAGLLGLQYKLANRLIYSKVKHAIGLDNIRHCVSGAAPLRAEVMEFLSGLDINICEVYGQSEGTGPTTTNRPGATKFGTVGQVFPGDEVKLAADGEILLKGPNVFLGYYKDEAATRKDLVDGWLHSGDLGAFDSEGYLTIVGRKKEIMITSGGKNIAPVNIEAALKTCPLVAEAVLIADRRNFISALLTLNDEEATKLAQTLGLDGQPLHTHPQIIAAVQKEIDEKVNPLFARVEQVRRFTLLPRSFTIENGELTPTLKLKRHIIYKNWTKEIEAMYATPE